MDNLDVLDHLQFKVQISHLEQENVLLQEQIRNLVIRIRSYQVKSNTKDLDLKNSNRQTLILKNELQYLNQYSNDLKSQINLLISKNDELKETLKALKLSFKNQLNEFSIEASRLESQNTLLSQNIETLKTEKEFKNNKILDLSQELEKESRVVADLKRDIEILKERNTLIEGQMSKMKNSGQRDIEDLSDFHKSQLESLKKSHQESLNNLEHQHQLTLEKASKNIKLLERDIYDLEKEREKLLDEMDNSKHYIRMMNGKIKSHDMDLEFARQETQTYKLALERAQTNFTAMNSMRINESQLLASQNQAAQSLLATQVGNLNHPINKDFLRNITGIGIDENMNYNKDMSFMVAEKLRESSAALSENSKTTVLKNLESKSMKNLNTEKKSNSFNRSKKLVVDNLINDVALSAEPVESISKVAIPKRKTGVDKSKNIVEKTKSTTEKPKNAVEKKKGSRNNTRASSPSMNKTNTSKPLDLVKENETVTVVSNKKSTAVSNEGTAAPSLLESLMKRSQDIEEENIESKIQSKTKESESDLDSDSDSDSDYFEASFDAESPIKRKSTRNVSNDTPTKSTKRNTRSKNITPTKKVVTKRGRQDVDSDKNDNNTKAKDSSSNNNKKSKLTDITKQLNSPKTADISNDSPNTSNVSRPLSLSERASILKKDAEGSEKSKNSFTFKLANLNVKGNEENSDEQSMNTTATNASSGSAWKSFYVGRFGALKKN